jgi:hypothetical protein
MMDDLAQEGILAIPKVSPMVELVVVGTALTAGNCTAFHLLDTSQLTVEEEVDFLAHSSDTDVVAAIEMREVELVCSAANASRAKRLLL